MWCCRSLMCKNTWNFWLKFKFSDWNVAFKAGPAPHLCPEKRRNYEMWNKRGGIDINFKLQPVKTRGRTGTKQSHEPTLKTPKKKGISPYFPLSWGLWGAPVYFPWAGAQCLKFKRSAGFMGYPAARNSRFSGGFSKETERGSGRVGASSAHPPLLFPLNFSTPPPGKICPFQLDPVYF